MHGRQFEFEWDAVKAAANARKHGVLFDLARTIFSDPLLLTIADLPHSEVEERWFSVGRANNGSILSVAYLWFEGRASIKIRIISARQATRTEIRQYGKGL
ncbi:MAG: BrnT family toxin [Acidobacteriaceae bacterium]|nr:BrnT family toxin [Acidobacteriaceae bacterium]MBV9764694.1 BrnT family toxin [Acidobacteriaceae bacterium]